MADHEDEEEYSESGNRIYRHQPRREDWTPPENYCEHLEEIEAHIEEHIGPIETVFHELISDIVHLDVLFVKATPERPYHVLVTSGVSDLPMNVPEGLEELARAELMIALPEIWPLTKKAFKKEANYWPVRWLKQIGRLPHEYNTWIGWGHTIPNGDPPEKIANTDFIGVMLTPPFLLSPDFFQLRTQQDETISFYNLVPLYAEEMALKLSKGADQLLERFEKQKIDHVLDVTRDNVARKRNWLW